MNLFTIVLQHIAKEKYLPIKASVYVSFFILKIFQSQKKIKEMRCVIIQCMESLFREKQQR